MLPAEFTPSFLRQLELFKLRARRAFLGTRQGGHSSIKRGHGVEFSDYRQYELGDNPRHIDWGLYARSERLYIKRYQEEQNLSLLLYLDASPSMFTPPQDRKWEMARNLALALSYLALMEQDSVVLSAPPLFQSPYYNSAQSIHALGNSLSTLDQEIPVALDAAASVRALQYAVSRIRFPGVCVVLSDFLVPLPQIHHMFRILRAKNLDITAIQILGAHDIRPLDGVDNALAVDSENGEEVELVMEEYVRRQYREAFTEHNAAVQRHCAESAIRYAQVRADQALSDVVVRTLGSIGLLS